MGQRIVQVERLKTAGCVMNQIIRTISTICGILNLPCGESNKREKFCESLMVISVAYELPHAQMVWR